MIDHLGKERVKVVETSCKLTGDLRCIIGLTIATTTTTTTT
jgi:predicted hydrocarbon binding protein